MASTEPFVPSLKVAPVVCMHCGNNAYFVRSIPDAKGRPYAYQMFQCAVCQRRSMRTVAARQDSDAQIEALAERMTGQPRADGPRK
jgi:hypothetical protein